MKRRRCFKRIVCAVLTLFMILGTGLEPLAGSGLKIALAAESDIVLDGSELAMGMNVIPKALAGDDGFLNRYVRVDQNTLNLNSHFEKNKSMTSNVKGAGAKLSTGTMRADKSETWYAQFKWEPTAREKELLEDSGYSLVYEGNIVPDYHTHNYVFWKDEHWSRAVVRLYDGEWTYGSNDYVGGGRNFIWLNATATENDGQPQKVKRTVDSLTVKNKSLTFTAYNLGEFDCGDPRVGGSVFYMIDKTVPKVTNAYFANDAYDEEKEKIASGSNFGFNGASSLTKYLVMEFSENVRLSDNYASGEALKVKLDACYGSQAKGKNAGDVVNLEATLVRISGNKMIFEFTVPDMMNGDGTHIYISGVSTNQSDTFNKNYDLTLFKDNGAEFTAATDLKATSRITDLVGNSLDWSSSSRSTGTIYFDNVAPSMTSIQMTGNMISEDSYKEPTSWEEGNEVDISAQFAGVGDTIGYQVYFSENVTNVDTSNGKAVLNIQDESGQYITLGIKRVGGNCITFRDLTVTDKMKEAGTRIMITQITGLGGISDYAGNTFSDGTFSGLDTAMKPDQQIRLDVDAPVLSLGDSAVANGTSWSTADANGGEYINIPIRVKEYTDGDSKTLRSTVNGQQLQFALVLEDKSLEYSWYIDTNPAARTTGWGATALTAPSQDSVSSYLCSYPGINDNTLYYLHIRLKTDVDYNYTDGGLKLGTGDGSNPGIYFNGTLYAQTQDWAGNKVQSTYVIHHQVDTQAPTGGLNNNGQLHLDLDFTAQTATITGSGWLKDNYCLGQMVYTWHYRLDRAQNWTTVGETVVIKESETGGFVSEYNTGDLNHTIPFTESTNRSGEIYLTVEYQDVTGRTGTTLTSQPLSYNIEKAASHFDVADSSLENPLLMPQVVLSAPTSEATNVQYRTLMFFPYKATIDGVQIDYIMYDPLSGAGTGNEEADGQVGTYTEDDLFKGLRDLVYASPNGAEKVTLPGDWYALSGTIDANGEGKFASYKNLGSMNAGDSTMYSKVLHYLEEYYGSLELIFVTSMFGSWTADNAYNFGNTLATVDRTTVYLANKAAYDVSINAVTDGSGADAKELLQYSPGEVPAKTLDNVAIELQLTNTTDENCLSSHGFGYGMETIDYGSTTDSNNVTTYNSYAELRYCGSNMNDGTVVYTWPVQPGSDGKQTLVIPEGVAKENGYYSLRVVLTNLNGTRKTYEPYELLDYYFFMDGTEMSFSLDSYDKQYNYDIKKGVVYSDLTIHKENLEASTEVIELGLDGAPNEDWTLTTSLTFSRTQREDGDGLKFAAAGNFRELTKVRVRNTTYDMAYKKYLEAAGTSVDNISDTTAIWVDASSQTRFQYVPVMAEGFPAQAYGTGLQLPMLAGYNLLVYELENTNGVVTRKEIAVYVHPEALEWQADYAVTDGNGDYIRKVTVTPTVLENPALDGCHFNYVDSSKSDGKSYVFTDDVDEEFYLLDQNGNLSVRHLAIVDENGQLIDIDGEVPYSRGISDLEDGYNETFHLYIYAYDDDSAMTLKDMTLTFDSPYSAALLGLPDGEREGTTASVTMAIPLAVDENGNYLKNEDGTYAVWESYDTSHNGIFKTQVIEEGVDEKVDQYHVAVEIWGTWKYDQYLADTGNSERVLTVKYSDAYGNEVSKSINLSGGTTPYFLTTGSLLEEGDMEGISAESYVGYLNGDKKLNSEGIVGMYSYVPFAAVEGYGAGSMEERMVYSYNQRVFHTTAPMILQDGTYTFRVIDLFGEQYDVPLDVEAFGKLGIGVDFSTTDPTNQDVIVTAWATGNVEKIISITSSTGVLGTIDPIDPQNASITVSDNCSITIKTDTENKRVVQVTNIDKSVDAARVVFYDASYSPLTGSETAVEGEVVARLVCDTEYVHTINGSESYIFPAGSKAGDTYTFEYMDLAGNVAQITATLPCDVIAVTQEGDVDKEAPELLLNIYGMRNQTNQFIAELRNPCDGVYTDAQDTPITGGAKINEWLDDYKAQQFKLIFTISDESATKFVVQESGAAAPTDYASAVTGSTVDGVALSSANNTVALTITANTTFDVYVIDAAGNRSTVTGITTDSIMNTAILLYPEYGVDMDESGVSVVTVTFLPSEEADQLEPIYPLTENVLGKPVEYTKFENGYDDPVVVTIPRYYYIFTDNGTFTFTYQDQYGNVGQVEAVVRAMSTTAAKVLTENWYGTKYNQHPSTENLPAVNRDVTALLNMSKAISNVTLYTYDAHATNGLGTPLDQLSQPLPVSVSFTGTNVYVTYAGNVDQKIVAEFTAAENGRKGYHVLDPVTCIDKTAPKVTVAKTELAEDHRSMTITFTVNEKAMLTQSAKPVMAESHVWIATDSAPVELQFVDAAGNVTFYQVTENAAVDAEYLEIQYSKSADGSDVTKDPVADLKLDQDEVFYIRVNKAATLVMNEEASLKGDALEAAKVDLAANTWTQLTLPDEPGLHILTLTDRNTGEVIQELVAAQPKDNVAPVLQLDSTTVVLDEKASMDELLTAIRKGVTITDNVDPSITDFTVSGYPDSVAPGLYTLTYKAKDEAGNVGTIDRMLYIMAEGTPLLLVNGEAAPPYGIVTIKVADIEHAQIRLALENIDQKAPVIIKYRGDIRTTGQMKYSSTLVEDMSFTLTERGHYTIYVRTQDRVEYVTYIYVEEE